MISFEDLRSELITAFKTVHDAHYPTTLVNFPNHFVVDVEHQKLPFVNVELDLSKVEQTAIGEREIIPRGTIHITYYYREGKGSAGAYTYADMIAENMSLQQFGALYFEHPRPMSVTTFPGWKGLMITMGFQIIKAVPC